MIPIIQPSGSDGIVSMIEKNHDHIVGVMLAAGVVLFRGFDVSTRDAFVEVRGILFTRTTPYREKATPRTALGDDVFTSTEFPQALEIRLHNENSYAKTWPSKLLFACLRAPDSGGGTTVADCRAVLAGIAPEVRAEFARRGWKLVRNYHDGFGLPWQEAFGTTDRRAVAEYCAASGLRHSWTGDVLRTEQSGRAVLRHPVTAQDVWFNHVAFWHESRLEPDTRDLLLSEFGPGGLPYNFFFGDGGAIPDGSITDIAAAYDRETDVVRWQPGDVLLVDNMLTAHGREAYTGQRNVIIALGDPVDPGTFPGGRP